MTSSLDTNDDATGTSDLDAWWLTPSTDNTSTNDTGSGSIQDDFGSSLIFDTQESLADPFAAP